MTTAAKGEELLPCPGCGGGRGVGEHIKRPCPWWDGPCEHGHQRRKCEVCELIEADKENERLQAALTAATERIEKMERVVEAAKELSLQLALVAAAEGGIYAFAAVHGMIYKGPTYFKERVALDAALAEIEKEG